MAEGDAKSAEINQPEPKQAERQKDYTYLLAIAVAAGVGTIFILVYSFGSDSFSTWAQNFTLCILVALASLAVGAFGGFLFGIPRRLQGTLPVATPEIAADATNPGEKETAKTTNKNALYGGNTNLEQISDWLTKIIIGVGLIQIRSIIGYIVQLGDSISNSLGQTGKPAFPIAIIVFFSICGFLMGYLWARLDLGRALEQAERVDELATKLDKLEQQHSTDINALKLARLQLADNASQRPSQEALDSAITAATSETKAYIFYIAQHARSENWRDNKAISERTIKIFRSLIKSDTDDVFHRNHGQLAYALKDQRKNGFTEAEIEFTKAISLRGRAEDYGFNAYEANRAICRISLDENYVAGNMSKKDTKKLIQDDLRVAREEDWTRSWVEHDATINAWMTSNKLTWDDVG